MQPVVVQVTTTPGTAVQVSGSHAKCAAIWVVNFSAQIVAFGNVNLNRSTGVGQIGAVPALAAGATPDTNILKLPVDAMAEDPYDAFDYWVDSATACVVNIIEFIL